MDQFTEYQGNPVLMPDSGLESKAVFNPTVIISGGEFYMFYRAESLSDELTGRIMLAKSEDGFNFVRSAEPVIAPEYEYEKFGCEDPRIVKFGDTFYLTYNGAHIQDEHGAYYSQICLATSRDLRRWRKHGSLVQSRKGNWCWMGHKSGAIVPAKLSQGYVMYFEGRGWPEPGRERIGIGYSEDLLHWQADLSAPVLEPRERFFDSKGIEPGYAVLTKEGILLVYNGWNESNLFRPGWVLFSREEPNKVLLRCEQPILNPTERRVAFAEGLVNHRNLWLLYYGVEDKVICVATCEETELDNLLRSSST